MVDCKPDGSTAMTGAIGELEVPSMCDKGGCGSVAGISRSGVKERPSESLKLFSRGILARQYQAESRVIN